MSDDWIGREIDNYRIEKRLGDSNTFKARQLFSDSIVALKILPFGLAEIRPESRKRFDREIEILNRLKSKNTHIIAILDHGKYREMPYYVTDYKEGGNLRQLLDRRVNPLSVDAILELFASIALALDYVHKHNIIHRDLKPENIVWEKKSDGKLHPYITDFGMAHIEDGISVTRPDVPIGTHLYKAPEMYDPNVPKTKLVDLYSLAVMFYEALEGKPPFVGNDTELMWQHLEDDPPYPLTIRDKLNHEAATVVLKALSKNPDERYQSGRDFINALKSAYYPGQGPEPTPRGIFTRARIGIGAIIAALTFAMIGSDWFPSFVSSVLPGLAQSMGVYTPPPSATSLAIIETSPPLVSIVWTDAPQPIEPTLTPSVMSVPESLTAVVDDPTPTPVNTPIIASTQTPTPVYIFINVSSANLRSGHGTNYPIVVVAYRGQRLEVISQTSNGWYLVRSADGVDWGIEFLWVSEDVISPSLNPDDVPFALMETLPPSPVAPVSTQPVPVCPHPGQFFTCESNGCPAEHTSQCNADGTGYVCVWDPAKCGVSSPPSFPPRPPVQVPNPGDPDEPQEPWQCTEDWLRGELFRIASSANPPMTVEELIRQLVARGYDLNGDGTITCADYPT